ncbi:elongation of very long chain fatty acids protein 2-like [Haliotis rufescens]|uniref:elongation of very long chain fatty acids protein 2-like n=1 Tax=Haliotis rufescens TaxID=6454 RepID=UPI00201FA9E4|nr:elongation of very long chain fatty acids protein 2-like [Haliotis rufescens]XP_048256583.1 elongation of very long chain fatty acids protein 2-like [Haliotis rufescens]
MASKIQQLLQQYEGAVPDPRTRHWLLVSDSPVPVWVATGLYLMMVLVGPRIMKNRQPFSLQWLMVVYNLGLVVLSTYMFIEIIVSVVDAGYDMWCANYNQGSWANPKEMRVAKVMWWYFFSKVIEFNDTLLMILRKKFNQITFLHVFHHATMLNIWWWVIMFIPGGMSWFGSWLNCLVHIVMYSYYGLSAIPALRGKLWWKKYITKFQLFQFCVTFTHTANSLRVSCDFPRWGQWLLTLYMVVMLCLFGNFYIQSYIRKHKNTHSVADVPRVNGVNKRGVTPVNGKKFLNGQTNGFIQHTKGE